MRCSMLLPLLCCPPVALAAPATPDLTISAASGEYLDHSDLVSYKLVVRNDGRTRSKATRVVFYGAKDGALDVCSAYNQWTVRLAALDPGESSTVIIKVAAGYSEGPLWSYVDVDRVNADADFFNNMGLISYLPAANPAVASQWVLTATPECLADHVEDEFGVGTPDVLVRYLTVARVL